MKTKISLLTILSVLLFGACEVPQAPLGGGVRPSAIPSESPDNGDPPCLQTLQCIIDETTNNSLRKDTQDIINQLFVTGEPEYTRLCEGQAQELSTRLPQCRK